MVVLFIVVTLRFIYGMVHTIKHGKTILDTLKSMQATYHMTRQALCDMLIAWFTLTMGRVNLEDNAQLKHQSWCHAEQCRAVFRLYYNIVTLTVPWE